MAHVFDATGPIGGSVGKQGKPAHTPREAHVDLCERVYLPTSFYMRNAEVGVHPECDIVASADGGLSTFGPASGDNPLGYSNNYPSCIPSGPEDPVFNDS